MVMAARAARGWGYGQMGVGSISATGEIQSPKGLRWWLVCKAMIQRDSRGDGHEDTCKD